MKNKDNKSHLSKRDKSGSSEKHISWGATHIQEFKSYVGVKDLIKAIKAGDLQQVSNIIHIMANDETKTLITSNNAAVIYAILKLANNCADCRGGYTSEYYKNIMLKFTILDQNAVDNAFLGFRIHLIDRGSDVTPQLLQDQIVVRELFKSSIETNTTTSQHSITEESTNVVSDSTHKQAEAPSKSNSVNTQAEAIPSQRSGGFIDDLDAIREINPTLIEDNPLLLLPIIQFLAWIHELPEWLQEQILNSAPIKALIESVEQWSAMNDKKSTADLFAELFTVDSISDATDAPEDNINAKVTIDNSYTIDQIDMSMVLNEAIVNGWILPTAAPGLNNFFIGSDSVFNELPINFNGLHGIGLF